MNLLAVKLFGLWGFKFQVLNGCTFGCFSVIHGKCRLARNFGQQRGLNYHYMQMVLAEIIGLIDLDLRFCKGHSAPSAFRCIKSKWHRSSTHLPKSFQGKKEWSWRSVRCIIRGTWEFQRDWNFH
ncbi:hypothetical protein SAY87_008371 [Trapa incisa]|uniref:Uncharacterized protein n=1 Tax=Trapa incisa TaxID=236973 RepID=A0AAN7QGB1_9MYRT|nr:hypothetical protein SAY87_008371 [Trapa incisa]